MADKIFIVITGIGLMLLGSHFVRHPELDSFRFGVINTGDSHKLIGAILALSGVFLLFYVLKISLRPDRDHAE